MGGGIHAQAVHAFIAFAVVTLSLATSSTALGADASSLEPMDARGPILIDGDADFTEANGVRSGSGTSSDPFVIENWAISAASATGIEVRNTRAAFTIRNVTVRGDGSQIGIRWANVHNAKLQGSTLAGNQAGLLVVDGFNFEVSGNVVNHTWQFPGLDFYSSTDFVVSENVVDQNAGVGVSLRDSTDALVTRNEVAGNAVGIALQGSSSRVTVYGNRIVGSTLYPADDWTGGNAWDGGYPQGGNFWSEYSGWDDCGGPNQDACPGSDGFGDVPFEFAHRRYDQYPLVPVNPPNAPPVAAFTVYAQATETGRPITFDASASWDPDGHPLTYEWTFGDGSTGSGVSVDHAYAAQGGYTVVLRVTDIRRAASTTSRNLFIDAPPPPENRYTLVPYAHETFSIPVPEGWTRYVDIESEGYVTELLLETTVQGFAAYLGVDTDVDPSVRETEAYLGQLPALGLEEIQKDFPDAVLHTPGTFLTVAGHGAVSFVVRYTSDGYLQKFVFVVSDPDDRFWILFVEAEGAVFPDLEVTFDLMVDGFEIHEPEGGPTDGDGAAGSLLSLGAVIGFAVLGLVVAIVAVALILRGRKRPSPLPPSYPRGSFPPPTGYAPTPTWSPPQNQSVPPTGASPAESRPVAIRFCYDCGAQAQPPFHFCPRCGRPL